jgi:hypothetical protein
MKHIAVWLMVFGVGEQTVMAAMQSSVSQWGITWTFDRAYEIGQFANGDYWVKGPVTITGMSPAFDGSHHGWEVNPVPQPMTQGFDSRVGSYSASLVPALPYTAQAGQSIVKGLSIDITQTSCRPCLKTAAVLTVVAAMPPDSGRAVFRPPYVGTEKPYYYPKFRS